MTRCNDGQRNEFGWATSLKLFVFAFLGIGSLSQPLFAQYGFGTPVNTMYGTPWGNTYVASVVQVPLYGSTTVVNYPSYNAWQGWQLGAMIQNQVGGVLIVQVVAGSIAERTGLKAGDVIVTVGGTQVGYVNGRVVDLVLAINQRVDANGNVRLVVLDSLTRQLRNYDLNIRPQVASTATVSGRVFLDGLFAGYGNGTIKVELTNATRPYLSASGGSTYVRAYGNGPFSYQIVFDPRYVSASDRYRLTATLYDAGSRVVANTNLEIGPPTPGLGVTYDLRLQAPTVAVPVVVNSYGYYYPNVDAVTEVFRRYLNRIPTATESQVWQQQLASGLTSLDEMKAEIVASPAFYDRAGNNPERFVQQMIESTTQLPVPADQLQYWLNRLSQLGGDRMQLAREYIPGKG